MEYLLIVVVIGVVVAWIASIVARGRANRVNPGERRVAKVLASLPKKKYIVLNDLLFKDGQRTTQIDHIVVSVYGIFVIETKCYQGHIVGNINRDYWTQYLGDRRNSLYNPLFQNDGHVSFLLKKFRVLKQRDIRVLPVVVFVSTSKLTLSEECDNVLWLRELKPYIRAYSQKVLTRDDCHHITEVLRKNNIRKRSERNTHVHNVEAAAERREEKVRQGVCPRCGGRLVVKHGRNGDFYGCSNYPDCRYTR